jgi:hypothetical protein
VRGWLSCCVRKRAVGQSEGNKVAKEAPVRGLMDKHDVESFTETWQEVGCRTGTQWAVSATLDKELGIVERNMSDSASKGIGMAISCRVNGRADPKGACHDTIQRNTTQRGKSAD